MRVGGSVLALLALEIEADFPLAPARSWIRTACRAKPIPTLAFVNTGRYRPIAAASRPCWVGAQLNMPVVSCKNMGASPRVAPPVGWPRLTSITLSSSRAALSIGQLSPLLDCRLKMVVNCLPPAPPSAEAAVFSPSHYSMDDKYSNRVKFLLDLRPTINPSNRSHEKQKQAD